MAQRYQYKLVNDIFSVDKTLTRNLYDNFGVTAPDWSSPQTHWYVIFYKKEWVGYACIRHHSRNEIDSVCYFGPTYIKLQFRGQGLQTKLIKRRLKLAKRLGYTKGISSTLTDNYPSCNSLIKCGFKLIKPWLNQEYNSLYWEKIL